MSAASNDNEQGSDLDEPMGSQSQVNILISSSHLLIVNNMSCFHAIAEQNSESSYNQPVQLFTDLIPLNNGWHNLTSHHLSRKQNFALPKSHISVWCPQPQLPISKFYRLSCYLSGVFRTRRCRWATTTLSPTSTMTTRTTRAAPSSTGGDNICLCDQKYFKR